MTSLTKSNLSNVIFMPSKGRKARFLTSARKAIRLTRFSPEGSVTRGILSKERCSAMMEALPRLLDRLLVICFLRDLTIHLTLKIIESSL